MIEAPAILIVEDEASQRMMLRGWVQRQLEMQPVLAADGQAALEAIQEDRQRHIQLILMDWNMPGLSGADLLKRFAAVRPRTPVIVLTASQAVGDVVEAMKHGAFDYLTKP